MPSVPVGPRKISVFICHRYKDDDLYDTLRRALRNTRNFRYQNLSVQDDMLFSLRTEAGLKRSITAKVKRADVVLVFAHSAGKWIAHELDTAKRCGVPVIAIVDPQRLNDPARRARSEQVTLQSCAEVSLDAAKDIVAAIRRHARPQRQAVPIARISNAPLATMEPVSQTAMEREPSVTTPADIARRISERRQERMGFMARIGQLFRRGSRSEDRVE